MKILAIADDEVAILGEESKRAKIGAVDFIISCGDLSSDYLSYISTLYGAPLYFVRGNHDHQITLTTELGVNLHNQFAVYHNIKMTGFEGCPRYNKGPIQYTERQMDFMVNQAIVKSWFLGKPDIIVTHATPKGIHDGQGYAHRGFPAFNKAINYFKPKYFLHGHNHLTYAPLNQIRETKLGETRIINVYGYYVFDY